MTGLGVSIAATGRRVPSRPVSAENLRHLADALRTPSARTVPGGQVWGGPACNDLRLVALKLMFLVVTRAVAVLGLSRREAWCKDAEILMLRHQLAVALRERPRAHSRLTWPTGRGWPCSPGRCQPAGWQRCG
jgi:hypothetical protein